MSALCRRLCVRFSNFLACLALCAPGLSAAQTEPLFLGIGMDTPLAFAHLSVPGATGIDFNFFGAFAPAYPPEESHVVVITFEWGATPAGPWTVSPDYVKSVPGSFTTPFDTGVFHGPEDAPWVRIHFYAGGLMTVSGSFSHLSVVPEPAPAGLLTLGLAALGWRRWRSTRTGPSAAGHGPVAG